MLIWFDLTQIAGSNIGVVAHLPRYVSYFLDGCLGYSSLFMRVGENKRNSTNRHFSFLSNILKSYNILLLCHFSLELIKIFRGIKIYQWRYSVNQCLHHQVVFYNPMSGCPAPEFVKNIARCKSSNKNCEGSKHGNQVGVYVNVP